MSDLEFRRRSRLLRGSEDQFDRPELDGGVADDHGDEHDDDLLRADHGHVDVFPGGGRNGAGNDRAGYRKACAALPKGRGR